MSDVFEPKERPLSECFAIQPAVGQDSDGNLYQLWQGSHGTQKWEPIKKLTMDEINA
jgi:hypothetical protein